MNFPSEHQIEAVYPGLFYDEDVAVQFLIEQEIVVIPVQCAECGGPMSRVAASHYQYQCSRKACNRKSVSILKGSFFSGCKSVAHLLKLCYSIMAEMPNGCVKKVTGYDPKMVRKWRGAMQEMMALDEQSLPDDLRMLGGPNWMTGEHPTVELDESKFGKIKYGWGHAVGGAWVFGLIEQRLDNVPGRFIAFVVLDRSAATLEPIIQQYVRPGSRVYSDMWKGYRTWVMNTWGMFHRTVNHSLFFKDPLTLVHTNTIEGMWCAVKAFVPPQCCTAEKLQPYLWEFIWRRRNKANVWARFLFLLRVIRYDGDAPIPIVQAPVAPVVHVQQVQDEQEDEFAWENMCVIS